MTTALVDDPVLALLMRTGFAVLFASAAWHKLRDRAAFAGVLDAYRVLPPALVSVVAPGLAVVELVVAVAWLVPRSGRVPAVGSVALLAVYSIAIAWNLWRGRRAIDCGCGAPGTRQPISEWLLLRNAVLATVAVLTLRSVEARPLVWLDGLTVVGALAVASSAWTAAHGLAAASHRTRRVGASR